MIMFLTSQNLILRLGNSQTHNVVQLALKLGKLNAAVRIFLHQNTILGSSFHEEFSFLKFTKKYRLIEQLRQVF